MQRNPRVSRLDLGVDLISRLRLEALGSGRVVLFWGPSRILVGSFDCFQVDLFHMNVIFYMSILGHVFRILHYIYYFVTLY